MPSLIANAEAERAEKKEAVINEILMTELSYVNDLKYVEEVSITHHTTLPYAFTLPHAFHNV